MLHHWRKSTAAIDTDLEQDRIHSGQDLSPNWHDLPPNGGTASLTAVDTAWHAAVAEQAVGAVAGQSHSSRFASSGKTGCMTQVGLF